MDLRRQISSDEAELLRFGDRDGFYRARLRNGTVLDVLARATKGNKPWYRLLRHAAVGQAALPGTLRAGAATARAAAYCRDTQLSAAARVGPAFGAGVRFPFGDELIYLHRAPATCRVFMARGPVCR